MKFSSETWIVIGAILLAALLAGQEVRNEWTLRPAGQQDMVHFQISHSSKGNKWVQGTDVPAANFRGLNLRQSGPAKFEYVEDGGSLLCEGRFSFGGGSGSYKFQPNPKFTAALRQLGYDGPTEDQAFSMVLNHVTLDFARGVRDAGLNASTAQLIELRTHGVTLPFIRETFNAGYKNFGTADFVELRNHGVTTEFLRSIKHAGYELSARDIADLRNHGVNSEYMRDLNIYGLRPEARDLVDMRNHGIGPEYLKGLKDAGFGELPVREMIDGKNHGLDPKFMQEARELGYDFNTRQLIDLKNHGVGAAYLRHLRESGMRNLSAEQITKLKSHGVE